MTSVYIICGVLVMSLYQVTLVYADVTDASDYTDMDDQLQQNSRALNIQERNDMVRILTNNLRTGRELYEKDLPDFMVAYANRQGNYPVKGGDLKPLLYGNWKKQNKRGTMKRQRISVPQLAQLLNSIKTRDVSDDGVKLQSLRFGR